jgi:hypothetical protein
MFFLLEAFRTVPKSGAKSPAQRVMLPPLTCTSSSYSTIQYYHHCQLIKINLSINVSPNKVAYPKGSVAQW